MIEMPLFVLARRDDPASSHEAGKRMEKTIGGQCARVLAALCLHGPGTSAELARASGLNLYMVRRRLPNLRDMGAVFNAGMRCCRVAGTQAMVWEILDEAKILPGKGLF